MSFLWLKINVLKQHLRKYFILKDFCETKGIKSVSIIETVLVALNET